MTIEIEQLCDRILAVDSPPRVALALGIPMTLTDTADAMEYLEGTFQTGAFATADLRANRSTGLTFLVLMLKSDANVRLEDLALSRYGSAPGALDFNPRVPPGGATTHSFVVGGVRVSFQFLLPARVLRAVTFEWSPRA